MKHLMDSSKGAGVYGVGLADFAGKLLTHAMLGKLAWRRSCSHQRCVQEEGKRMV